MEKLPILRSLEGLGRPLGTERSSSSTNGPDPSSDHGSFASLVGRETRGDARGRPEPPVEAPGHRVPDLSDEAPPASTATAEGRLVPLDGKRARPAHEELDVEGLGLGLDATPSTPEEFVPVPVPTPEGEAAEQLLEPFTGPTRSTGASATPATLAEPSLDPTPQGALPHETSAAPGAVATEGVAASSSPPSALALDLPSQQTDPGRALARSDARSVVHPAASDSASPAPTESAPPISSFDAGGDAPSGSGEEPFADHRSHAASLAAVTDVGVPTESRATPTPAPILASLAAQVAGPAAASSATGATQAAALESGAAGRELDSGSVMGQVRVLIRPVQRSASIELHPHELGRVSVDLQFHRGEVEARFQAESAAALEVLERHLPELRAELTRQGLDVRDVSVSLASDDGRAPGDTNTRPDSRSASFTEEASAEKAEGTEESDREISLTGRVTSDGVDTYA